MTNGRFNYELACKVSEIKIQYQCSTQNGLDMERDLAFLNRQMVADGSPIAVTVQGKPGTE